MGNKQNKQKQTENNQKNNQKSQPNQQENKITNQNQLNIPKETPKSNFTVNNNHITQKTLQQNDDSLLKTQKSLSSVIKKNAFFNILEHLDNKEVFDLSIIKNRKVLSYLKENQLPIKKRNTKYVLLHSGYSYYLKTGEYDKELNISKKWEDRKKEALKEIDEDEHSKLEEFFNDNNLLSVIQKLIPINNLITPDNVFKELELLRVCSEKRIPYEQDKITPIFKLKSFDKTIEKDLVSFYQQKKLKLIYNKCVFCKNDYKKEGNGSFNHCKKCGSLHSSYQSNCCVTGAGSSESYCFHCEFKESDYWS